MKLRISLVGNSVVPFELYEEWSAPQKLSQKL